MIITIIFIIMSIIIIICIIIIIIIIIISSSSASSLELYAPGPGVSGGQLLTSGRLAPRLTFGYVHMCIYI